MKRRPCSLFEPRSPLGHRCSRARGSRVQVARHLSCRRGISTWVALPVRPHPQWRILRCSREEPPLSRPLWRRQECHHRRSPRCGRRPAPWRVIPRRPRGRRCTRRSRRPRPAIRREVWQQNLLGLQDTFNSHRSALRSLLRRRRQPQQHLASTMRWRSSSPPASCSPRAGPRCGRQPHAARCP